MMHYPVNHAPLESTAPWATYDRALYFAVAQHRGQTRAGGAPYITHLIEVAENLRACNLPQDEQVVGLLHDTLEDTSTTFEQLVEGFGIRVADAVHALTDYFTPKHFPTANRAQRKVWEAGRLVGHNSLVQRVKLADIASNLDSAWLLDEGFQAVMIEEAEFLIQRLDRHHCDQLHNLALHALAGAKRALVNWRLSHI